MGQAATAPLAALDFMGQAAAVVAERGMPEALAIPRQAIMAAQAGLRGTVLPAVQAGPH
jgi:hypothetical protein